VWQDAGIAAKLLGMNVIDKCLDYVKVRLEKAVQLLWSHRAKLL